MAEARRQKDLIAELQSLADAILHRDPPKEIVALKRVLLEAREQPILEKQQFVDLVNTILRASGYRIRLPDGDLCLLCLRPGGSGAGYIQFQSQRQGSRGGFTSLDLELVPATIQ